MLEVQQSIKNQVSNIISLAEQLCYTSLMYGKFSIRKIKVY